MLATGADEQTSISTHSLTRRLTSTTYSITIICNYFNSQPHKEADRRTGFACEIAVYFNSQPHKEAD